VHDSLFRLLKGGKISIRENETLQTNQIKNLSAEYVTLNEWTSHGGSIRRVWSNLVGAARHKDEHVKLQRIIVNIDRPS
jgi:hypothetical protein